ncbi:hypothetical protein JBE27_04065 [Streptomyces albiflaviniger]|nr:hypothetical protein [Streptomyces albiflaviniger]
MTGTTARRHKDRDDAVHEQVELVLDAEGEDDPVEGLGVEPSLDGVGHRLRRVDERRTAEFRDGFHNLTQGEVLGLGAGDELDSAGAATLLGEVGDVRERGVQVVRAEVVGDR